MGILLLVGGEGTMRECVSKRSFQPERGSQTAMDGRWEWCSDEESVSMRYEEVPHSQS